MRNKLMPLMGILLACVILLPACQKRMSQLAEKPTPIPYDIKIGIVPFSQPLTTSDLITGHIPEAQGHVPKDALHELDNLLRSDLKGTTRLYTWLPAPQKLQFSYHDSGTPQALPHWMTG